MIRYEKGNLLDANAEALVNTVNEVGVMGKGIALLFREAFPENAREYQEAAKAGKVRVGRVLVTRNVSLLGPRWIIHFPTKKNWRQPSKLEWIRTGLADLSRAIRSEGIRSIALPPVGCGNGGLDWNAVRQEIERALADLTDVEITVYGPTPQYYNAPKRGGVEDLTPARALVAELVRRYEVLGFECSVLEVQKLAWFLSRSARGLGKQDPFEARFAANRYGPYDDRLRHLLDALDGCYLHCEKRLGDAKPLDIIRFEDAKRETIQNYLESSAQNYREALELAGRIIDGFESPLGMELLATVDWLIHEEQVEPAVPALRNALAKWPKGGKSAVTRKMALFDDRLLGLALDRIRSTLGVSSAV
jgi:O-acetyl-ADP-ribose deacetylase (regulator of RNase III)